MAREHKRFREVAREALLSIYTNSGAADEFSRATQPPPVLLGRDMSARFQDECDAMDRGVDRLESLKERLSFVPLSPEAGGSGGGEPLRDAPAGEAKVFVVHGRAWSRRAHSPRATQ
jgi:hypothetical protein